MLHFRPNYLHRILRSPEPEVHVTVIDNPTVEPAPAGDAPTESVTQAIADVAAVVELSEQLHQPETTPPPWAVEFISGVNNQLADIRQSITTLAIVAPTATEIAAEVVAEVVAEVTPVVEDTPETVVVDTGETVIEQIPANSDTPADKPNDEPEARKKRKVRWI